MKKTGILFEKEEYEQDFNEELYKDIKHTEPKTKKVPIEKKEPELPDMTEVVHEEVKQE